MPKSSLILLIVLALAACDDSRVPNDTPQQTQDKQSAETDTTNPPPAVETTAATASIDKEASTFDVAENTPQPSDDDQPILAAALPEPPPPRKPFKPVPGTSWQWQLSGPLNLEYDVEVYDLDLFDTPTQTIQQLQSQGRYVICYFSAGSYEEWRLDADAFGEAIVGKPMDGWPGERWLDIRAAAVKELMTVRLDLAAIKGCDAVEPDNVDSYLHDTGFPLTPAHQLAYAKWLAREAHKRSLLIGLKNNIDQIAELQPYYDFAVNEQCSLYAECLHMQPFIAAGKAVFRAEYEPVLLEDDTLRNGLCSVSNDSGHSTLILPRLLNDRFRFDCLSD